MKSRTITLCGSARFESLYHLWNKYLTLSGHTVFGLGAYPSIEGNKDWYEEGQKLVLDQVHKLKILRSDVIVLLSVNGYVGESTKSEILWAESLWKPLYAAEVGHYQGSYFRSAYELLTPSCRQMVANTPAHGLPLNQCTRVPMSEDDYGEPG